MRLIAFNLLCVRNNVLNKYDFEKQKELFQEHVANDAIFVKVCY